MGNSWTSQLFIASLQGTVGLVAVWLLCLLFRRIPAAWRCWMWRLALVKMIVALFFAVPIATHQAATPAASPVVQAFVHQAPKITNRAASAPTVSIASPTNEGTQPTPWPFVAWGLGVILVFGRAGAAWRRTLRALRLERAEQVGTADGVRTLTVEGLTAPGVIGVVRPTILLPMDLSMASAEALRSAVAHEMAHVRRGDVFWNLAAEFCRGIFWFHPLVWLACGEQHAEAEIAADTLARSWTGLSPRDYGRHLLQWLRPTPQFAAPGVLFSTDELTRRITAMSVKRYGRRSLIAMGVVLAAPIALALIPATLIAGEMAQGSGDVSVSIPAGSGQVQELFNIPESKRTPAELQRSQELAFRQSAWASKRIDVSPVAGTIYTARLADGRKVELLGLTHWDPGHMESWSADGTPLPALLPFIPMGDILQSHITVRDGKTPAHELKLGYAFGRQAVIRVSQPGITGLNGIFVYPHGRNAAAGMLSNTMPLPNRKSDGTMVLIDQGFAKNVKTSDLVVRFFDPPKSIGTVKVEHGAAAGTESIPSATVEEAAAFEWDKSLQRYIQAKKNDTILTVSKLKDASSSLRISVVSRSGKEYMPFSLGNMVTKKGEDKAAVSHWLVRGLSPKDIASLRYSVTVPREVRFLGVHLHPNK